MKNQYTFALASMIKDCIYILVVFNDFCVILASKMHPQITFKSILEVSGVNLVLIWFPKVDSGWILNAWGSIFH